jgi:hypothetical protein
MKQKEGKLKRACFKRKIDMKEVLTRARAPVRIDFSGGWTDVALFTGSNQILYFTP